MSQLLVNLIKTGLIIVALHLDPSNLWYKIAWWFCMITCWVFFLSIVFVAISLKYLKLKADKRDPFLKNNTHAVLSIATAGVYLWLVPEAGIPLALALLIIFKGWIK